MRNLIFQIELRIDNFKAKRRLKKLIKRKANLEWTLGIELKRASEEECEPLVKEYKKVLRLIEMEKLFMLDLS